LRIVQRILYKTNKYKNSKQNILKGKAIISIPKIVKELKKYKAKMELCKAAIL